MAKSKAKMAIITRTKNRQLLLERAIKSVLAQTNKDYVHVIVNDGGDQSSLDALLSKYPDTNRFVIHNDNPLGLTAALNQGIRAVSSDYIAILDDDDSWSTARVEKVIEYLTLHPEEVGVAVYMDRVIERIDNHDKIIEESRNRWHEGVDYISLYDQCLDNYLSNGCFTYRRSLYDELKGYDESLEVAEDWDFGIRCLLKYDIQFLPEVLTFYHHRPAAKGAEGNSVFAGVNDHKRSLIKLRNKYLRQDINDGVYGIGAIMNHMNAERQKSEIAERRAVERVVRIEGHVNHVGERVLSELRESFNQLISYQIIYRIKKALGGKS